VSDPTDELKQMHAGIMAVVQQNNAKLQESQEKAEKFQASVKADISSVRADLKAENEGLIQRFEK
jgi:sensor domain CHASE-containing protein